MNCRTRLFPVLLCLSGYLAGCQTVPPQAHSDWPAWFARIDTLDEQQLELARVQAMQDLHADSGDENRLRAGYVLSRPEASLAQLEQSRQVIAQIPGDSELGASRDLLDKEIQLRMRLQRIRLDRTDRELELERLQSEKSALDGRMEGLLTQIRELQMQLEALKSIEEEMVETQQETDDMQK